MITDKEKRIEKLKKEIETKIPELKIIVAKQEGKNRKGFVLHQDAFASEYQEEEYTLLGMVIKYAGLCKVNVLIVGENEESLQSIK